MNPQQLQDQGYWITTDRAQMDQGVIHYFLRDSYWAEGIAADVVSQAIANSRCFGVFRHNEQVGFARVISDYATFAYLADVFIMPEHRGKGLSKWLMDEVLADDSVRDLRRVLLVTKDAHSLYQRNGFQPLAHPDWFMEIWKPGIHRQDS